VTEGPGAVLGWIKPDDGVSFETGVAGYECFGLDAWLRARGRADVRVVVATSVAEAGHGLAELLQTGEAGRLLPPARQLVAAGAGAVCWACTSGSFAGGADWARDQVAALTAGTGRPATSAALALADAVRHLDATAVDLLSPYPEPLTGRLRDFFASHGITVLAVAALGCEAGADSHRLDLPAAVARFTPRLSRPARPLVIPDSAVNTLDLVGRLEEDLGRPVVTANQATLWKGLGLLGRAAEVPGAGALLAGSVGARRP
jgi:maleate isomerase